MNEKITYLYNYSMVDVKLQDLQAALKKNPNRIEEAKAIWLEVQKLWEENQALLEQREKERREKEAALQDHNERIKQREARLYEIKTNKEYQAAVHELSETKKSNRTLEDEILKKMEEVEGNKKLAEELKQKTETRKKEFEEGLKVLEMEQQGLQDQIQGETGKRDELRKLVDPQLLDKYERIRQSRQVVIAYVSRGTCESCFMRIPPQLHNQILQGNDIHVCPNCHRILFLSEVKAEENSPKATAENDA